MGCEVNGLHLKSDGIPLVMRCLDSQYELQYFQHTDFYLRHQKKWAGIKKKKKKEFKVKDGDLLPEIKEGMVIQWLYLLNCIWGSINQSCHEPRFSSGLLYILCDLVLYHQNTRERNYCQSIAKPALFLGRLKLGLVILPVSEVRRIWTVPSRAGNTTTRPGASSPRDF